MNTPHKVLVVGDGGAGKTTWIRYLLNGKFDSKYIPTLGVEVIPYLCNTNAGQIYLTLWDCAGDERFGVLGDAYYLGAEAAILFVDAQTPNPMQRLMHWYALVHGTAPNVPIVVAVSKYNGQPTALEPMRQYCVANSIAFTTVNTKDKVNVAAPVQMVLPFLLAGKEAPVAVEWEPALPL